MPSRKISWPRFAWVVIAMVALNARAGGGPQNVLVVFNREDADSVELARYYAERRGIPQRNLCAVSIFDPEPSLSAAAFEKQVRRPVHAYIERNRLTQQIDFAVLCWNAPTRVNNIESITSALYYGFKNAPAPPPCVLQTNTHNPYFRAERAFKSHFGPDGHRRILVTQLTARTLEEAKQLVDRSVASDGTAPEGTFYLLNSRGDGARNVRHILYDEFDFHARLWPGFPRWQIVERDMLTGLTDVMGYMVGLWGYAEPFWTTNRYLPGALADHLTSFGGQIPIPGLGQSTVWNWIGAGASGSYGTVNEPCNFPQKFPHPMVFFWYARGFNLAESYWMSVEHPHQGLIVGDPLMAPYARPLEIFAAGVESGQVVSGTVTVRVTAVGAPDRPCGALDLYIDDVWTATLTNVSPCAWNEAHVMVDDRTYSYIVGGGDDLYAVVEGLARRVRAQNPMLNAIAFGDRLMLLDGRIGKPGASVSWRAWVEDGLGAPTPLRVETVSPTFVDSRYAARKALFVEGPANSNDVVELLVRLADGFVATVKVVAAQGEEARAVIQRLAAEVANTPVLNGPKGIRIDHLRKTGDRVDFLVEAAERGAPGIAIIIRYAIFPAQPGSGLRPPVAYEGRLGDTVDYLCSRAVARFSCGWPELSADYEIVPSRFEEGPHTLRFVVRDGTAVQTQTSLALPIVIRRTPAER